MYLPSNNNYTQNGKQKRGQMKGEFHPTPNHNNNESIIMTNDNYTKESILRTVNELNISQLNIRQHLFHMSMMVTSIIIILTSKLVIK